ncbi:MAG: hypothetical protein WEE36_00280 [Acidimicrobiia bacterium]
MKMRVWLNVLVLVLVAVMVGCGGDDEEAITDPPVAVESSTTTTVPPTTTTVATTTIPTTTTTTITTTTVPEEPLPTYSEVLAGFGPCSTKGDIEGGEGGSYSIKAGAILDPQGGMFCRGAQFTTVGPTVLPDGTEVPIGSFLTIGSDGYLVRVSSFSE